MFAFIHISDRKQRTTPMRQDCAPAIVQNKSSIRRSVRADRTYGATKGNACAPAASGRPMTIVRTTAKRVPAVSTMLVLFTVFSLQTYILGFAHRLAGGTMLFIRKYSTI